MKRFATLIAMSSPTAFVGLGATGAGHDSERPLWQPHRVIGPRPVLETLWPNLVAEHDLRARTCPECWRQDGKHNSRCPNRTVAK